MAAETGGEAVRGTGARLRCARERQGLSVLQAAERLHLDARMLEALEAEDFAVLGADVYVRGHLRRYAELLGESPQELQELYVRTAQGNHPDLTRIPHPAARAPVRRMMLPALLGLGGFALLALLGWLLGVPGEKPQFLGGPADAPAVAGGGAGAASAGTRTPAAASTQLTLKFLALSWVEVSDTSGKRLLQGLFAPDAVRTLRGEPPLRVVLGNAPAVNLAVDGQAVPLAGMVRRDGSARLLIDAAGHVASAPPRLAHGD